MEMFNPPHPGTILLEDWIKPLNFRITEFAIKIGTSRKNLSEIVNGKCGISPEMALKLSKALGLVQNFGSICSRRTICGRQKRGLILIMSRLSLFRFL